MLYLSRQSITFSYKYDLLCWLEMIKEKTICLPAYSKIIEN